MLRVSTLYASSAVATAAYCTRYLAGAPGEEPPGSDIRATGFIPRHTVGLTMATFRQTASRADDPQLHTHAVISAKVQTVDGRWRALDARFLKRHQRMLGGLY